MSGAEHYQEAERLLAMSVEAYPGGNGDSRLYAMQSQVHATLALVAAAAGADLSGALWKLVKS